MTKVYVLINHEWYEDPDFVEVEEILGVFSAKENAVEAANKFAKEACNDPSIEEDKENIIFKKEFTYEDLIDADKNSYVKYNGGEFSFNYQYSLYIISYELDKLDQGKMGD